VAAGDARRLGELLGLSDDELCAAVGADPLDLISGDADVLPQVAILRDLLAEAEEKVSEGMLRSWVRTSGPQGVPVELLTARNWGGFEDALGELAERGFVIRRSGS
jgi:hypothetical protein